MHRKLIIFSIIYVFVLLIAANIISNIKTSEGISDKVLRFHILANSDSQSDQNLKLKVRDAVLTESKELYKNCNSVDDAVKVAKDNSQLLEEVAKDVIEQQGYNYNVKTYVTKEYYDTRIYEDFTLPAGVYDSLKIEIGNAKGHNWWCVVFPSVCLSGCTDDFDNYLTEEEKEMILNDDYIIKFKVVEIYEKIISKIKRET